MIGWIIDFFGPRWFLHILPYFVMAIAGWIIVHKLLSPTTSTKIGNIEKQVNVYESPKQPLFNFGCSNLQAEAYWKKSITQSKGK